jgi:GTPase-activating protein SAC7
MPPGEPSAGPEASARRDLASWWKNFKKGPTKRDDERGEDIPHTQAPSLLNLETGVEQPEQQGIFGVPLQTSVRYANVAISLNDANGQSYIYGYVPIVVAKCGVFLKEKGTWLSHLPFSVN